MAADPLDTLRLPDQPVPPRAEFATNLRARLAVALTVDPLPDPPTVDLPDRSATMTDTTRATTATTEAEPTVQLLTPYLIVDGGAAAIDFYRDALGAVELVRMVGDDGRIGHAELEIGGAHLFLADQYPDMGLLGPNARGGSSVSLHLEVDDVDARFAQAVAAGAAAERPPADQFHGSRSATIVDPFGHRWMLNAQIEQLTADELAARSAETGFETSHATAADVDAPIEVGYFTLSTTNATRAAAFFGPLFGWRFEPGNSGADYAHVGNTKLPMGFSPHGPDTAPTPYFRVRDIEAYVARVVDLGGRVEDRTETASGRGATCYDDQGTRFDLWQPAPGY